jgi:hypothetical protein
MQENARLTFRITLWRPWLLAVTPFLLVAIVPLFFVILTGDSTLIRGFLLLMAIAAGALLLLIGIVVQASRWHVDPTGIGGRNNMLIYHRLNWSEIDSVQPWLIPGYHYLQVNSRSKQWVFWVPLFFTDMPAFRAAVTYYAPPGNPLRRFLEEYPD